MTTTASSSRRLAPLWRVAAVAVFAALLPAGASLGEIGDWDAAIPFRSAPAGYLIEGRYAAEPIVTLVPVEPLPARPFDGRAF